jgi:MPBQ/MSBQ methyltransferase
MKNKTEQQTQSHYTLENLTDSLLEMIKNAGIDIDNLNPDDLAPLDEFHMRGRAATIGLAETAGIKENMRVLDVGSGIGGPSRFLAANFGCHVTGIDLIEEYCKLSEIFAEKLNMSDRVDYQCCNACELPFDNESFDVVWTQHVAMNIEDKEKLYKESTRVLKPNGKFAIYDVLAGENQPIHFPVPWAREQAISFLATFDEMKSYLEKNSMEIMDTKDFTQEGLDWFKAMKEKTEKEGPPPLSIHLLLGNDFGQMVQNLIQNLSERRIKLGQIVSQKTAN